MIRSARMAMHLASSILLRYPWGRTLATLLITAESRSNPTSSRMSLATASRSPYFPPASRDARRIQWNDQVLEGGQAGKRAGPSERRARCPHPAILCGLMPVMSCPWYTMDPPIRFYKAGDEVHQGGLARPLGPMTPSSSFSASSKLNRVHGGDAAKALGESGDRAWDASCS